MYLKPEPYIDLAEAPSYEASFKLSDHVTFFLLFAKWPPLPVHVIPTWFAARTKRITE